MAHHFMLPSDSWEPNSSGEPTSSAEDGALPQEKTLSIDRLAILLSPSRQTDDLARDLQLNEIVIQACLATGATGAAIALARGDEFICRASTGNTAPDLGMKLNIDQGLSAFCIHTGEVQRCDDSDTDARVDAEVCRHLGVRSVLVVPIVYSEYFLGIFEIFSPDPFAFADRDIQTIMALSKSVLKTLGIEPLEEHRTAISEGDLKATEVEIQSPPIEINLPRQAVGKFLAGYGNEPEDNPVPIPQPPLENVPTGVLVP
jgi:putative methionine-R-sulfoxide reductase with GAF domain